MRILAQYRAVVAAQFTLQRLDVATLTVLAALVCPSSLWIAASMDGSLTDHATLASTSMSIAGAGFALAFLSGMLFVARPYIADAAGQHTYVLSLPIPRTRFALLRAAAGATLAMIPAAGFGIGALVAAAAVPLPALMQAYPVGLTLRFILCQVLAVALFFGLQYGAGKHAAKVAFAVLLVLAVFELAAPLLGMGAEGRAWQVIAGPWSPLSLFLARWALFDV